MFSKIALPAIVALSAMQTATALPTTSNPAGLLQREATIVDGKDQCYWESTWAGAVVSWGLVLTRWGNNNAAQEIGDLKASLHANSDCAAITAFNYKAFGPDEIAVVFNTPTICTAYQMTKILTKTNGNAHGSIPCTSYDTADGGPDASDLMQEIPIKGEPVPDVDFERRDDATAAAAAKPAGEWSIIAKMLGLPATASEAEIEKAIKNRA